MQNHLYILLFLKFIFNKLDSFYDYGEANFETFIAAIESMMNYIISSTNIGKSVKNTSFTPVIYDLKETFSEIFILDKLIQLLNALPYIIITVFGIFTSSKL